MFNTNLPRSTNVNEIQKLRRIHVMKGTVPALLDTVAVLQERQKKKFNKTHFPKIRLNRDSEQFSMTSQSHPKCFKGIASLNYITGGPLYIEKDV